MTRRADINGKMVLRLFRTTDEPTGSLVAEGWDVPTRCVFVCVGN